MKTTNKTRAATALLCSALLLIFPGCVVGPHYNRPAVDTPGTFKEVTPDDLKKMDGWKVAQPQDSALHGKWWEIFGDPQLNALEEQVNISNQNVASAFASFMAARALVREARAQYFPTLTVGASATRQRTAVAVTNGSTTGTTFNTFSSPFDASWTPDLFGRVRNTVRANVANAQASAADLENTRLTAQAELAVDYFQLRGQDALKQLLDATVVAYTESLNLTKALYETGIDSDESVAQAETQLEATQALDTNLGILRAQYEHAIALLVGKPASSFSITAEPLKTPPPAIPLGVPSQLLERRPDVAANERLMAQANAQIGVAVAAYYPTVTLSASAGFQSPDISKWFNWSSRFWSVGTAISETIYDGGLRRATVEQFRAQYDETVANYRNTVLTAFEQVEDDLASLRILSQEIGQQDTAIESAQRSLKLATDRYRLGIDPYLNVITAQTALFSNQQTAVNLRITQIVDSVQLVEALGGGWDASTLPTSQQIISRQTQVSPATVAQPPQSQPPASSNP
ncbi:MAG TPA: efflux transporter outer membrane subunit [Terriglobales bacterium]|jgi:NodT family efflux transporter outer membrane factor (OMF) lipoprotein|nr:efflux transporter outer membrane subunit [Terriglobales bacterium]